MIETVKTNFLICFYASFLYLREYPVGIGIDIEKLHLKSAKNDWSSLSNFCLFSFPSPIFYTFFPSLQYLWAVLSFGPFGHYLRTRNANAHLHLYMLHKFFPLAHIFSEYYSFSFSIILQGNRKRAKLLPLYLLSNPLKRSSYAFHSFWNFLEF